MYTLLIVEDEVYIADKIKTAVKWEELRVTAVHVAHNVRQAKEVINRCPVDVIICDIEMPQGSGIELLSWLRENAINIEFLFLTCHSEFEYTKKAIQFGILDYLLKPVQPDELKAAVTTAIKKLDKERPLLIERFWLDLIHQDIPAQLDPRLFPHPDTVFLPVLIGIHRWRKQLSRREENIMEYALRKAAEEIVIPEGNGQIVHVSKGSMLTIVALTGSATDSKEWKRKCEAFVEAGVQYFYCELSCYIGEAVPVQEVYDMYQALSELHANHVTGTTKVYTLREKPKAYDDVPLPPLNVWSEMIKRGERKLIAEVTAYFDNWKRMEGLDAKTLQQVYQRFLQMYLYTMQQKGIATDELFPEHMSPERALAAQRTVAELQRWMTELLEATFSYSREEESTQTLVDKIKRYITLHIDQALSRQYIADHIGLSPDYTVKLFKKETGISISDYIVQERMNIAKELLIKSDMPISNIALAVGYSNFAYFSTIFKKEISMTPQEYRKLYQLDRAGRP